jgi:dGTPase
LTPGELRTADLWREVWDESGGDDGALPAALRVSAAVKRVIDLCVSDLLAATSKRIADAGVSSPDDVRAHAHLLVGFSEGMGRRQRELSRTLHERFYRHPRLVRAARRAGKILRSVFEAYVEEPAMLPREQQAWVAEAGLHRGICDYIAAMTDREAGGEYRKLNEPFVRD